MGVTLPERGASCRGERSSTLDAAMAAAPAPAAALAGLTETACHSRRDGDRRGGQERGWEGLREGSGSSDRGRGHHRGGEVQGKCQGRGPGEKGYAKDRSYFKVR